VRRSGGVPSVVVSQFVCAYAGHDVLDLEVSLQGLHDLDLDEAAVFRNQMLTNGDITRLLMEDLHEHAVVFFGIRHRNALLSILVS